MCFCVCTVNVCNLSFKRSEWHLDNLYVFAVYWLGCWGLHMRTNAHTHKWQGSLNCVCVGSLCYLWRRDPCRLARLFVMRKEVTSFKDHTCSTTVSFSLTHTHTLCSTAFSVFSAFLIYKCTYFEMLLTVNWQLHVQWQPKARKIKPKGISV